MNPAVDSTSRPALAPGVRLQADPVSGETVLLFPEGVLVLNETAQAIAERCDGQKSVHDIVAALAAEYDMDEATLTADARECLDDFAQRNLIIFRA